MTRDEELNQAACEFDNHYRGGQDAILHAFVAGAAFERKRSEKLVEALETVDQNGARSAAEIAREALKLWRDGG